MRDYRLKPFKHKHHQSPEEKHAVIEYQTEHGQTAPFLHAYASGSGALSFNVVNEDCEIVINEEIHREDIEHFIRSQEWFKHHQVLEMSKGEFVIHTPIDRIDEHTLWMDGEEIKYSRNEDFDKYSHSGYEFNKTLTVVKKDGTPEYYTVNIKNAAMHGALAFYLIYENKILNERKLSKFNQENLLRALQESGPYAQIKEEATRLPESNSVYLTLLNAIANADMLLRIDDTFNLGNQYNTKPFTSIEKKIILHSIEDLDKQFNQAREKKVPYPAKLDQATAYSERNKDSKERKDLMQLLNKNNGFRIYERDIENINSGPLKPDYNDVSLSPDGFEL